MEKDKYNSSAYSVPGSMQDFTLLSTPQPQATSTASKRSQSQLLTNDAELKALMEECERIDEDFRKEEELEKAKSQQPARNINDGQENTNRASLLDGACKNISEIQEKVARELAKLKRDNENLITSESLAAKKKPSLYSSGFHLQHDEEAISKFLNEGANHFTNNPPPFNEPKYSLNLNNETRKSNNKVNCNKDFEFLIPSQPAKSYKKSYSNLYQKTKNEVGTDKYKSSASSMTPKVTSKVSSESHIYDNKHSYLQDTPEKLSNSLSTFGPPAERDRASMASSVNSSLGIISHEELDDVKDKPLTEFSQQDKLDLSQRLAKELSLDSSLLKEDSNLDMSALLNVRMEQVLAAKREENKENKTVEQRESSDSYTIHGYSTDSSTNGKNDTAKEYSRLSLNSIGELEVPVKESSTHTKIKPLSQRNSASSRDSFIRKSASSSGRLSFQFSDGKQSVGSNPFGDYSKLSVGSEVFQSGEDLVERLRNDEKDWKNEVGRESIRSLSGIYGAGDISIRTQEEKLSISSFLRSGSGPLGCLETAAGDTQRPNFGHPVVSPEKKGKSRPLLPPKEDNLTFSVDEMPTKDKKDGNPWNPHSLIEQFSMIHSHNESDVSVPSLSCIGDMLADMRDGLTPRDLMDRLLAASRNKQETSYRNQQYEASVINLDDSALSHCGEREKLKTITAVVPENGFCRGYDSDRSTRYSSSFNSHISLDEEPVLQNGKQAVKPTNLTHSIITIEDSIAPSICNISDFEGEEEFVCVLIPESMDFDIFNNYPRVQHYSIAKACYVNERRQDSAALIHIPETNITLQPEENRVVSVTVAAVIGEIIKIKLDVTRTDSVTKESETKSVFGKICAELPKIFLFNPPTLEMKPVDGAEFHGEYNEVITLKNNGKSVVPIRLTLIQASHTNMDIFHFDQMRNTTVTFRLEPGQMFNQKVFCQTPPIYEVSKKTGDNVMARVDAYLATSAQIQLPPLVCTSLKARLNSNFFGAPSSLFVPSDSAVPCKLYNSGTDPATFAASTTIDFNVQPSAFTIQPRQMISLLVTYSGGSNRVGTLTLQAIDNIVMHSITLRGNHSFSSSNTSFVTPQSSRAPSPTSPCSSVTSLGGLQLACTHKELVWGGCALQQRAVKTCSLKNQNSHREKLLLSVTDPHNCFKLLNEKKSLEKEVKLSLQPMENCQISVAMLPGSTGPKWGHLTISRINFPQIKKVLPLYAFGGKAKVNIEGILQDPEQHMWLYLDPDSLSTFFTLTNTGDYSAFVKISEGISATTVGEGLSIAPPEQVLLPGHSVCVEISLCVTPERLEYLLAQSSQTAICITRLAVIHGDESTRLRLSRLSRIHHKLANKLCLLNQSLTTAPVPDMDKLGDPSSCAETLWQEDVNEWTIGVLVKRSVLEALRLDTSVEFVDLATTVIH